MVAVYNTFGEVEAARPRDGFKKYAGALAGAWAVLFVAAVMIIGTADNNQESVLLQGAPTQMLAFKEFEPERNVFEEFDADFVPEKKFEYDLANEADFSKINIASGVEGSEVTEGIPDPYAVYHQLVVPEAVYTQPPPYDTTVVEIGEKIFGEPFHEYTAEEEGEAVMGKEYEDTIFDKTLNSVPEPNPSRDWEVLDVQNEPNPNY
mmetsp:Transcript_33352/g.68856  ORF Transcript_33352/g.68856 Transcript_33352/m.68856 type:complete len:206 (+) Transcript_33352:453-1070(+)|eukprot:CAMPEP_0181306302 /NCGR_PEP_ID=MMETSP1101-20121128/10222_1 /TAXON_ID=46948 /ORGANISM="Rhodomonas abbreviata, Strain Caron Lab Isolate" /LENGTH=205 /DNA_ID=CAMNT_0023412339 /DNA_START=453 /DNA_END=1070 /DNA_ORIENTATION=-